MANAKTTTSKGQVGISETTRRKQAKRKEKRELEGYVGKLETVREGWNGADRVKRRREEFA